MANQKRKNIQLLLIRLTREKNSMADSVLQMLNLEPEMLNASDVQTRSCTNEGTGSTDSIRNEERVNDVAMGDRSTVMS